METEIDGSQHKSPDSTTSGWVFRPRVPRDTHEVVLLFATASRAVCAAAEHLEQVSRQLAAVCGKLVAPEALAAAECMRMWQLFVRVADVPKPSLRREAGRAFCRDLDTLAQRLDLPPLAEWDDLPARVDDGPEEGNIAAEPPSDTGLTVAQVRLKAQEERAALPTEAAFPAPVAARLLAELAPSQRRDVLERAAREGILGKAEVNLLIRWLVKGGEVSAHDTVLVEALERLGDWLTS